MLYELTGPASRHVPGDSQASDPDYEVRSGRELGGPYPTRKLRIS